MTWVYDPDHNKPLTHEQARKKLAKAMNELLVGKHPGQKSLPTKKATKSYPLKLTRPQRESLRLCTRLSLRFKKRIEAAGEGTQVVSFTMKELNQLNDEIGTAAVYAPSPHKKRLLSVLNKIAVFFEEENKAAFGIEPAKARFKSSSLFQFKITLLGSKPLIWRRIQVQDCTLDKLHEHIQTAMGWTNSHLHQFEIKGNRYGDPELLDDGFDEFDCVDSTRTKLSDILPQKGKSFRFKYEYDFGDGWEHEVLFEGCPPVDLKAKYPLCLEGERACPPEDCGGIWGYAEFLEVIRNPKHEDHEGMLEWVGGSFDPEDFDPKKATKEMKKGLPDWRSMD